MYKTTNYTFYLIACFVGGFTLGITIGFYITGDTFLTMLFALIIGLTAALAYFSYIILSSSSK